MTKNVETYFIDGCGRCALGGTPKCKVHNWDEEIKQLRRIILNCELSEESKWGMPTYTFQKNNILMLAAFKEYCCISFFKGALLNDGENILVKQGVNTQAALLLKFTDVKDVINLEPIIKAYIYEAIEVEKAGLKVELKKNPEPMPEEFQNILNEDLALKNAFEALTPSKQRGYIIHFSQPKQTKTRSERVEKCIPKILIGKGFSD
jgi:uncharacterized protein YdeI (YjbR/CyaY-like superfamily)